VRIFEVPSIAGMCRSGSRSLEDHCVVCAFVHQCGKDQVVFSIGSLPMLPEDGSKRVSSDLVVSYSLSLVLEFARILGRT
jgi:hypothetical protein